MLLGCTPDKENMMDENGSREIVFVVRQFLSDSPALIADELGYYTEEGLQIKTVLVEKGKYAAPLLLSGEADLAILGNKWTILSQIEDKKNETEIIADLGGGGKRWRVMSRIGSNISSIQDLNNKKLGSWLTSYGFTKFTLLLEEEDIDIIPIQLRGMSGEAALNVLDEEVVDAVFVWEPHPSLIEENAVGEEIFTFEGLGDEMSVYLHARTDFLETNPEAVLLILKVLKKAQRFILENSDEAAEIISPKIDIPAPVVKNAFQYIDFDIRFDANEEEEINQIIDSFKKTGINELPDDIVVNLNSEYIDKFERAYGEKVVD